MNPDKSLDGSETRINATPPEIDAEDESQSSDSAVSLGATATMVSQLENLVSDVKKLSTFLTQSVATFEERFQALEVSAQDYQDNIENRLQCMEEQIMKQKIKNLPPGVESSTVSTAKETDQKLKMGSSMKLLAPLLMNNLTLENCISIFHLAFCYGLDDLRVSAQDMICKNFSYILKDSKTCKTFSCLSSKEVKVFIFSDYLNATEKRVFKGIMRWIQSDLFRRQNLLSELLPAVRVHRCSLRFLRKATEHFLVQNNEKFLNSAKERIEQLTSKEVLIGGKEQPRVKDIFFVMGGSNDVNTVETQDPAEGFWTSHKFSDAPSGETWICSLGHEILVMETDKKRFRSFDVLTKLWKQLSPPPSYREGTCMTQQGSCVYVIGGKYCSNHCDRYNHVTDRWEKRANTCENRYLAAATSHEGKLYCSGGYLETQGLSSNDRYQSNVEMYDPQGKECWSPLPSMKVKRYQHCLVSNGQYLWAIGGRDTSKSLSSMERFNITTGDWTFVCEQGTARYSFSTLVYEGLIYTIGGYDPRIGGVATVEVYNPLKDSWTASAFLQKARYSQGTCVVRSLPNEDEYASPTECSD